MLRIVRELHLTIANNRAIADRNNSTYGALRNVVSSKALVEN